jgi:hypothetical protein
MMMMEYTREDGGIKQAKILQFRFRFSNDGSCYFNGMVFFNESVRVRFPLSQLSRFSSQFIFSLNRERRRVESHMKLPSSLQQVAPSTRTRVTSELESCNVCN